MLPEKNVGTDIPRYYAIYVIVYSLCKLGQKFNIGMHVHCTFNYVTLTLEFR